MKVPFEMDQELLQDAIDLLEEVRIRCEADACALARLDSPEMGELALRRLRTAVLAGKLVLFFAQK